MKVNKMIGKAMAATVAVTMMLGGATVMADEIPVMHPLNAQEAENQTPGQTTLRDESKNELERMIQEILDQAAQDATTPDEEESVPVFDLEEDTTPVQKPAEIDEPEAEFTIEVLGLDEEDEETDDALFHTGDILRITNEPTTLPAGVYRIYYTERDFSTFTCASFYMHNGRMIMQRGGVSISIGLEYRALRIKVLDNGTVELHPMTPAEIAMYDEFNLPAQEPEVPEIPETPVILDIPDTPVVPEAPENPEYQVPGVPPTVNTATPINYSEPAIPAPVATISETPAPAAETPAAPSAPAAVSAPTGPQTPVTQVAGAVRTGVEGFVDRLYVNALNRNADESGRAYWINILNAKEQTGTQVANGFFNSVEFASRNLNNEQFVQTLYKVFFDRKPDQAGLDNWINALNNGATRSQVIAGFTGSSEWTDTCNAYGINA